MKSHPPNEFDFDVSPDMDNKIDINNVTYDKNGKDTDQRPLLDSGASHCCTPFYKTLINVKTGNFGKLRGVTGTTHVTKRGTLQLLGGTIKNVLVAKTAARPLISTRKILEQFGGYILLGTN